MWQYLLGAGVLGAVLSQFTSWIKGSAPNLKTRDTVWVLYSTIFQWYRKLMLQKPSGTLCIPIYVSIYCDVLLNYVLAAYIFLCAHNTVLFLLHYFSSFRQLYTICASHAIFLNSHQAGSMVFLSMLFSPLFSLLLTIAWHVFHWMLSPIFIFLPHWRHTH